MKFNSKNLLEKIFGDKKYIKTIFYIFLPIALQSLVTISITYVDNFFIAKFATEGSAAKTALGLVSPVTLIPQLMLIGSLTGAGIMTAQYYGKGDHARLKETILFKLLIGFFIGAFAMVIIMTLSTEIINVVSQSDNTTIKRFADTYLFWSGLSMIPLGIAYALEFSLKDTKQTMIPLIAASVAMVSNIILDPIFIMDSSISDIDKIRNIAITTMIARVIEAGIILIWLAFNKKNSNYFYDCRKISLEVFKKITFFGWQVFFNESIFGFLNAFFIIATFHYNPALEDAMTTYSLLTQFTALIWPCMAAVCSVIVGSELGKNNIEQAKYNSKKAINWSLIIGFILAMCILISTFFINELLSPDATPDMIKLMKEIQYILIPVAIIQGPYSIVYYSLRAGSSKYLILVDAVTSCSFAVIIAIIVYVPNVKQHVNPILFIFILEIDNVLRLLIASIAYKYSNWTNDLTFSKAKKNIQTQEEK